MLVRIKRQENPDSCAYWQEFEFPDKVANGKLVTVTHILNYLNSDHLHDIYGKASRKIRWECSCMQKLCGACAMVINGVPKLACGEFIDCKKTKLLILEPLSKFPVFSDLYVDRSCITEFLKNTKMFVGKRNKHNPHEYDYSYDVGKCLKCGICLEACPNFKINTNKFHGAVFANEAYLNHDLSANRKKEISTQYKKHFGKYCSKSLSCHNLCPMNLPTLASISYMNRK